MRKYNWKHLQISFLASLDPGISTTLCPLTAKFSCKNYLVLPLFFFKPYMPSFFSLTSVPLPTETTLI